jgi:hypothetical protein
MRTMIMAVAVTLSLSAAGGAAGAPILTGASASVHPNIGGVWVENSSGCPGAKITITQTRGVVTSLRNDAPSCQAAWVASNIGWTAPSVLTYDFTFTTRPQGWEDGRETVTFNSDLRTATAAYTVDSGATGSAQWTRTSPVPQTGDTQAPVVVAVTPKAIFRKGTPASVAWTVRDNKGKAKWWVDLYSDGTIVASKSSPGLVAAKGRTVTATFRNTTNAPGPFYFCVRAQDAAGNVSDGRKKSSCAWISWEVPVSSVANGCGTAAYGETAQWLQNWFGNKRHYGGIISYYRGFVVIVKQACDIHDAAYAGVTVLDPATARPVDFRTWTRQRVDTKFMADIRHLCRTQLTTTAEKKYLSACLNGLSLDALKAVFAISLGSLNAVQDQIGALSYYEAVRTYGGVGYDTDATIPGKQQGETGKSTPAGGIRDMS